MMLNAPHYLILLLALQAPCFSVGCATAGPAGDARDARDARGDGTVTPEAATTATATTAAKTLPLARFSLPVMGTVITAALPDDPRAQARARLVFEAFVAVDQEMSEWKPGSPLAHVNAEAGKRPVQVPAGLLALIERALTLCERSAGAYDITWAALWGVWDFKADDPVVPDLQTITERLALIGWEAVTVNRAAQTVFLPKQGMVIGLGSIAKGLALDRAGQALIGDGAQAFTLSAGGQVLAFGPAPQKIAIAHPRDPEATLTVVRLSASNAPISVSTSGDYERFFMIDGRRYHHILDPRTGRPSPMAQAATVVGPDATLADALSTALMVMGPKDGLAMMKAHYPQMAALIVGPEGAVFRTSNW